MEGQTPDGTKELDLDEVQAKATEGLREARGVVESFARENPRLAVGIALGAGFVLGGGLTPRILFALGAIAARRYVRDLARDQLGAIAKTALAPAPAAATPPTAKA